MLVCGTLVYSRGDEVQNKKDHLEFEAHAAEEGEAQPSVLMPGKPFSIGDPFCCDAFRAWYWAIVCHTS